MGIELPEYARVVHLNPKLELLSRGSQGRVLLGAPFSLGFIPDTWYGVNPSNLLVLCFVSS
jgi:hypothetical protein